MVEYFKKCTCVHMSEFKNNYLVSLLISYYVLTSVLCCMSFKLNYNLQSHYEKYNLHGFTLHLLPVSYALAL